jgi:hypothetical protein
MTYHIKKYLGIMMTAWLLAAGGTFVGAQADIELTIPVTVDYWQYENALDPNDRLLAPSWILDQANPGDRRHGTVVMVFDFTPPSNLPSAWRVKEARLRHYDMDMAQWVPGTTNDYGLPAELQLYKAGFGPTYDEATWDGTQPIIAPYEPFCVGINNGTSVTQNVTTATPWALGEPIGYNPGSMTEAFPIDYQFDIEEAIIQQEFRDDILAGKSVWMLSSTHDLSAIGAAGTVPSVITQEGVSSFPGSQPPTLYLTIESTTTAAENWSLFE